MSDKTERAGLVDVLRIGILGAVRAWRGRQEIPLGPPRQRAALALLALDAGRLVSVNRLIEGLWGERPPAGAPNLLQGYVSRLRPALAAAGVTIAYRPRGYQLGLDPGQVDVHEFRATVARARAGETAERQAAGLRRALALWRGEPLTGVSGGELLDRLRDALGEERLSAVEECLDAETRAGRDAVLVPELIALVAEHPFREGLVGLLMLALCRAGRRADALERYERTRRRLTEELGLDPGPELRQLHQRILRGNVPPIRTPDSRETVTPAQLPPGPGHFTGRAAELRLLDPLVTGGDPAARGAAISVVTGAGGAGKTALALHWAHRNRHRFPDGQLYVDLRGHSAERPLRPIEALGQFLRGLGLPAERVPGTVEEASAAYRSLLADRRMLVVLDNAGSEEQVRPLLPGGRLCATLITSRDRLDGLVARDGAVPVPLGMLSAGEAVTLFGGLLGGERLAAERDAALELARACGRLPLALRIAAAGILGRPGGDAGGDISGQVRRLTGTRLSALAVTGDPHAAVRGAFDLSYHRLDPAARRLFRLLALVPGPTFTAGAAAALAGAVPAEAERLLSGLAAAHLVEEPEPGRYTFHDLMREYARERVLAEEAGPGRASALDALLAWYLRMVRQAGDVAYPHLLRAPADGPARPPAFAAPADALAWLDAERANLVAAVRTATDHPYGWRLIDAMNGYLDLTGGQPGWTDVLRDARRAARAAGDHLGQAAVGHCLASTRWRAAELTEAVTELRGAFTAAELAGWPEGKLAALAALGVVHLQQGRLGAARRLLTLAVDGSRRGSSVVAAPLVDLGLALTQMGRLGVAEERLREALSLCRDRGLPATEAAALASLGAVFRLTGRLGEAVRCLTAARGLGAAIGERYQADLCRELADVHLDAGRRADALGCAEEALRRALAVGDPKLELDALLGLGRIRCQSDPRAAIGHLSAALERARGIGATVGQADALVGLAVARTRLDEHAPAMRDTLAGLALARKAGAVLVQGAALAAGAEAALAAGDAGAAIAYAARAARVHAGSGYKLGEARALLTLGRAHRHTGDEPAAERFQERAGDLFTAVLDPPPARPAKMAAGL
ncbi:AfsR family transcriptional regulator [Nonomuraea sp. WAC 01424]|uniref:AfsR/SARP family transcriptional regulator n=1 Tax=Nonomuraea sp. WAC 01424 TaxID=2203200 RepID=UPI000F767F71|nr:BTAD domain-containing putative transcriptional regulator [Nonomuraea sp. WAC 01424]RSN12484.1 AfsR family transcriptional regulator [Nonomuraea sp. WAC 01424]